jgi:hypothetical protein
MRRSEKRGVGTPEPTRSRQQLGSIKAAFEQAHVRASKPELASPPSEEKPAENNNNNNNNKKQWSDCVKRSETNPEKTSSDEGEAISSGGTRPHRPRRLLRRHLRKMNAAAIPSRLLNPRFRSYKSQQRVVGVVHAAQSQAPSPVLLTGPWAAYTTARTGARPVSSTGFFLPRFEIVGKSRAQIVGFSKSVLIGPLACQLR